MGLMNKYVDKKQIVKTALLLTSWTTPLRGYAVLLTSVFNRVTILPMGCAEDSRFLLPVINR